MNLIAQATPLAIWEALGQTERFRGIIGQRRPTKRVTIIRVHAGASPFVEEGASAQRQEVPDEHKAKPR